jgi:hypothetical protein
VRKSDGHGMGDEMRASSAEDLGGMKGAVTDASDWHPLYGKHPLYGQRADLRVAHRRRICDRPNTCAVACSCAVAASDDPLSPEVRDEVATK